MIEQVLEVYQPMPDNIIRVYIGDGSKKLEVLASYKEESHFSVSLTNSKAEWLASELKSSHGINWIRLDNDRVLRVVKSGEITQLILFNIKGGQEIQTGRIGMILEEVIDKVIDCLKANP
jgi:tartrate dehydratase beta subunit/fumarate hydratase class I family protein